MDDIAALLLQHSPDVSDSVGIRDELATLVNSTHAAATHRSHRRRWRIGISALSISLLLGGVSTAAASPAGQDFLSTHPHVTMKLPWSTKNVCVNTAYVGASRQSPTGPASSATIAAARKYVKEIDFDNIVNTKAWKTASAKASARAAQHPTEFGTKTTTESFDQYTAYSTIVDQLITSKLRTEGVDIRGLVYMGGTSCHRAGQ